MCPIQSSMGLRRGQQLSYLSNEFGQTVPPLAVAVYDRIEVCGEVEIELLAQVEHKVEPLIA